MIGRIVRPVDFERVLAAPQRSRSTHFAVHYLAGSPLPLRPARLGLRAEAPVSDVFPALSPELSTAPAPLQGVLVDDLTHWVGLVVPKRHAKRAVTRSLLKRQLRAAMHGQAAALPPGLWVLRLRAPFDKAQFLSPASELLREHAHDEIAGLLERAATAPLAPWTPRPRSANAKTGAGKKGPKDPGRKSVQGKGAGVETEVEPEVAAAVAKNVATDVAAAPAPEPPSLDQRDEAAR